ncbi:MAG TPA: glycosyltransferase, partial [Thermoanaerobaculia bacterium]|nr:glycosyltransferase [Thermoanaerobaculia bacterium]
MSKTIPGATIDVVIPALNEEASLPLVLADLPRTVRRVVVADNGSVDGTARVAREGGAEVVMAPRRGYGSACLAGLAHLRRTGPP